MIGLLYRLSDRLRFRILRHLENPRMALGHRGEDLAHRFLQHQGFTVVARNYRPRSVHGEIDLVAWDGDWLVFVEVKSRSVTDFGEPDRAVDHDKRASLIRSATEYLRRAGVGWEKVRFDIVNVILSDPPSVTLVKDAFHPGRRYYNTEPLTS